MVDIVEGPNIFDVQLVPLPPPEGNVSGVVTDYDTGQPVVGVLVSIQGLTNTTDSSGAYAIAGLTLGNFPLTFEKAGYETQVL